MSEEIEGVELTEWDRIEIDRRVTTKMAKSKKQEKTITSYWLWVSLFGPAGMPWMAASKVLKAIAEARGQSPDPTLGVISILSVGLIVGAVMSGYFILLHRDEALWRRNGRIWLSSLIINAVGAILACLSLY